MSGFGKHNLVKYSVAGGVAGLGFHLYNMNRGTQGTVNLFGKSVPLWAAGAIAGFVASGLTDLVHYALYNTMSHDTADWSSQYVVAPGLSAGSMIGLAWMGNKELVSDQMLFLTALGVGSQLVADKAYGMIGPVFGIEQSQISQDLFYTK